MIANAMISIGPSEPRLFSTRAKIRFSNSQSSLFLSPFFYFYLKIGYEEIKIRCSNDLEITEAAIRNFELARRLNPMYIYYAGDVSYNVYIKNVYSKILFSQIQS